MPLLGWESVDRNDPHYKTCVGIATAGGAIVGGATGSFLGPAGTVAGYAGGAIWGMAAGYLACPYLAPAVRRKIEGGMPLTDMELRSAAEAMSRYANVQKASDAVKLISLVKNAGPGRPGAAVCADPARTAQQLLARS